MARSRLLVVGFGSGLGVIKNVVCRECGCLKEDEMCAYDL